MVCASDLGMGLLTNDGPQPWHPGSAELKAICRSAAEYCKSQNVELAQLALNYSLALDGVATHLVAMQKEHLLNANLQTLWNGLNEKERTVLEYIEKT